MTFDEMYNRFNGIISDVKSNEMGRIMVQIGMAATTMIRERIMKTGMNAQGSSFPPYSQKMLSGCSNWLNKSKCEAYIKTDPKWVMIDRGTDKMRPLFVIPGGYAEFKKLNLGEGHGNFVDFSFSNRMWMNIKLYSSNTEHNQGVVRIGATTEEDKIKLVGNTKRKGRILELSKSEIKELSGYAKKELIQIFSKNK